MAFRGHREADVKDLVKHSLSQTTMGNFQALLKFRVESGDETLRSHLQSAAKNGTYCSPQIQNELISCAGLWIRRKLVADVQKSGFFSVLADEVTDVSNLKQLSLVLRFVDTEN